MSWCVCYIQFSDNELVPCYQYEAPDEKSSGAFLFAVVFMVRVLLSCVLSVCGYCIQIMRSCLVVVRRQKAREAGTKGCFGSGLPTEVVYLFS